MVALWPVVILAGFFPFLESKTLTTLEKTNLNRFLGEVARCARVPAISMSLVRDGQIVYTNGFGTANKQRQVSASSKTVFCLGDITQTFTATLLAKLLDEHQNFTWDTPVQEIIGAAINFGDRYRNDYLSLRDIVSMRTGLSNMDAVVLANAMDRSRLISKLRFAPKVATFRERYVYNNLLFAVAEEVSRSLGQDTWYKLVQDHLLAPLGMTDTFFITKDVQQEENLAQPVMSYNGVPMPIPMEAMKGQEIVAAGSSICSTADDMAKWLQFNLNKGGTQGGGQILSREALMELFRGQTTRSDAGNAMVEGFSQPDVQVSYTREANTLGWIKGHYRGFTVLSQDGTLPWV
ncbi:gigasin-6-like [Haliotis rubra]|uniref:gigasin-6-like n=1 Tax=Haliotis rubra TaxID=36100 RepID=UPI001EE5AF97|nr:gigasin-6-like [Haliotis rubra]